MVTTDVGGVVRGPGGGSPLPASSPSLSPGPTDLHYRNTAAMQDEAAQEPAAAGEGGGGGGEQEPRA